MTPPPSPLPHSTVAATLPSPPPHSPVALNAALPSLSFFCRRRRHLHCHPVFPSRP
ncbi:hypothetical protein TIFTF001_014260 [Ficus carica]|uniref:Uncharacterized protein n=1 Tax=Ficus carica TaxID=3494 RepID=A0AA87ZWG7_FICCA|nr:hypothetical protein TIFTF001_014260 [Ficus carica]